VFATDHINGSPIVDTLQVNLSEVCTLSRNIVSGDNGHPSVTDVTTATWTTGTQADSATINGVTVPAGASHDTARATVLAGNFFNDFARSSFKVTCNGVKGGYKVTVAPSAFTGVADANTWDYAAGGADYTAAQIEDASASAWTLDSSASSKTLASNVVWSRAADDTTAFNEDTFTITYKVKVATAQQQGTYKADAVYVLADIAPETPDPEP
jgi:hypothetical protein